MGHALWAMVSVLGLPALRIAIRYRGKGDYCLVGYDDGPGGDFMWAGRRLTRQHQPRWFRLMVVIEVVIVFLLIASIMLGP